MDKKNVIARLNGVLEHMVLPVGDKQILVNIFSEIIDEAVKHVDAINKANEAKSAADAAQNTATNALNVANGHTSKITALESKTKAATTAALGIVKQATAVSTLAGTEDAAAICNKVNEIITTQKAAGQRV